MTYSKHGQNRTSCAIKQHTSAPDVNFSRFVMIKMISESSVARNIGVLHDTFMSMEHHVARQASTTFEALAA